MLALSPMLVFMAVYLVGSILAGDFYKVPLTVYTVAVAAVIMLGAYGEHYGAPDLLYANF